METLASQIRPDSPEYRANHSRMTALVDELRLALNRARQGGGEKYLQRHREQGKLPVRERLERLLGRKTMEIEILREALAKSETKKPRLRLLSQPKDASR